MTLSASVPSGCKDQSGIGMLRSSVRKSDKKGMISMAFKFWLDDIRPPPHEDYLWCHSVDCAKAYIEYAEKNCLESPPVEIIDCDHDMGDYFVEGGDGIKLLDWLLERNTLYRIRLHTMNPVGRDNMQRMINRYWP